MTILIRQATMVDVPIIVEIYNSTISDRMATADTEPITLESRLNWFQSRDLATRPVWVAEKNREVAGWLSFNNFYGRPAYSHTAELSIYVAEHFRRQGIGNELLAKAIAKAPQLKLKVLLGFIFAHNQPSIKLFKNHGFESWGLLPQVAELDGQAKNLEILGRKVI